jgi:hypothetical protein
MMMKLDSEVGSKPVGAFPGRFQMIPLEYAGKWVAWSADGRIVAVGETRAMCESAAIKAGFADNQVAFEKIPEGRQRRTGSRS